MRFLGRLTGSVIVICSSLIWFLLLLYSWGFQTHWVTIVILATVVYGAIGWWLGKQYDKVRYYSERDVLTNLYNKRFVFDIFPRLLKRVSMNKKPISILLVDADNLKVLNDHLGHLEGDVLIRTVADVLLRNTRKTDVVARIGGDEFFILAPFADKESALKIVERIERELQELSKSLRYTVSASIGVSTYPDDAHTLDGLFIVADTNMYVKKKSKPQMIVKTS